MTEEYKSNSHRARERGEDKRAPMPERRTEKVVAGEVRQRKKTGLIRALRFFMPGNLESIKNYILTDVMDQLIRREVPDILYNIVHILFGEQPVRRGGQPGAKVSYRQYYGEPDSRREYARPRAQAQYDYDDIIFDSRGDAEEVLFRMEELLERFEAVSVADLFDMAGISCNYTDNKYGWTDLQTAHVERVRDGYVIRLPRACSLQ